MRRYYFTHFRFVPTNNDTPPVTPPGNPPVNEEVEKALTAEREKFKKERETIVSQLEQLKKIKGLTEKEKEELQEKVNTLQSMNLSKEEIARQESERIKKTYEEERDTLVQDRDGWKDKFENFKKKTEILSASSKANAFNSDQLVELLLPKTKLIELKENVNGEEVTNYQTIVKFADRDKDGKPVVLELTVENALQRMRENPGQYGNLFKSDVKGGTGLLNSQGSGGGKTGFRTDMSAEEYAKYRKEQGFGSKVR
jgi:hypothetical protein